MSTRYPGGLITKSPVVPTTSSAPGIWTMEQALQYIKAGTWPLSGKTVEIKIWGAGGAGGDYDITSGELGGPGGFATATFTVAAGTTLSIVVGAGGLADGAGTPDGVGVPNGGGGKKTDVGTNWSGGGGGLCAVFVGSVDYSDVTSADAGLASKSLIIAGSGGGGGYYVTSDGGGYGGGTDGGAGMNRTGGSSGGSGGGGSATAGGAAGSGGSGGTAGSFLQGATNSLENGASGTQGGGGGAGWYGGGSGSTQNSGGGGGGGSGMIASITSGTSLPTGVSAVTGNSFTTQTGTATTAPNTGDSDYVSGRGAGGASNGNGGDGLIIIYVNGTKYSYNASASVQTLTV
jgi:hypothetical protein